MGRPNSTVVCKPQIPFSQRLTDSTVQCLTVAQLRKKARDNHLDVSRLTQKWEFVHVLVQNRWEGAKPHVENKTDTKRRTIFDLPGEIRNKIYSFTLVQGKSIVSRYEPARTSRPTPPRRGPHAAPLAISNLRNLSWANRDVHKEVRSLFFRQNCFRVTGTSESSYTDFLSDVGADGRANITELDLDGSGFSLYRESLYYLLRQMTSLRTLTVRMHLVCLVTSETRDALHVYLATHYYLNPEWENSGPKVKICARPLRVFARLPALQHLLVRCELAHWDNIYQSVERGHAKKTKVEMAVREALFAELEEGRDNREVEIKVQMMRGAHYWEADEN
jgi:hypothetical protein